MLRKSRLVSLMALFAVFGLVAAACGDSDDSSSESKDSTTTTEAAASAAPTDADIKALTATIAGGGASFPDAFYQAVNTDFNGVAGKELVTYAKSGSTDGRKQLSARHGGLRRLRLAAQAGGDLRRPPILYFPTVAAPITVSYNLEGVDDAPAQPGHDRQDLPGRDHHLGRRGHQGRQPRRRRCPSTPITVVHRSDGSGTTNNFTKYLKAAAPDTWKLDAGDTVNWPATTQGAEKNTGVAAAHRPDRRRHRLRRPRRRRQGQS